VAASVRLAVETGVAGLSIEDSTGDASESALSIDVAVERMRAARKAIDAAAATCCWWAAPRTSSRAGPTWTTPSPTQGLCEAGADCLYAPGIKTPRADRRRGRGRGAQAGQPAGRPRANSR
jgi:2-methylisocitrate lyase-like PEP mutase family enzyme